MKTSQTVIFQVHSSKFQIAAQGEKIFLIRGGNSQLLSTFNMETDPIDFVADDIAETMIELCTQPITTDGEVVKISQEVYVVMTMFYSMRDFRKDRVNSYGPEAA